MLKNSLHRSILAVIASFSCAFGTAHADCFATYKLVAHQTHTVVVEGAVATFGLLALSGKTAQEHKLAKEVDRALKILEQSYQGGGKEFFKFVKEVQEKNGSATEMQVRARLMYSNNHEDYCPANGSFGVYGDEGISKVSLEADLLKDASDAIKSDWQKSVQPSEDNADFLKSITQKSDQ